MKTRRAILVSFLLASVLRLGAAEFGYPVGGEPWYFIKAAFRPGADFKGSDWKVGAVLVNGVRSRDYLLYQDGLELTGLAVKGDRPFEVKVRSSWTPGASHAVELRLAEAKTGRARALRSALVAPPGKGCWNPAWKNYLSLVVAEESGIARVNVPVHARVGVLSRALASPDEVRVVLAEPGDGGVDYSEVPCQVYDVARWADEKLLAAPEKDEKTGAPVIHYHPTTTFSVAFPVDLDPGETATFLVFYNNPAAPKPSYASDLTVSGQGLGKTVENDFYKIVLQEKSGAIHEIHEKASGLRLEHKLETNGAVHWNPDVYAPPHAWYHASDWDHPPSTEVAGPVFYSLRRAMPLPFPEGVDVAVTYYFYAGLPYVIAETVTEIRKGFFGKALRGAEIVFNKEVFSKAAYKTAAGPVRIVDFASSRMHPDHAAVLRPDTPWVSFYDEAKGVGFASLFLDCALANVQAGPASQQQPFIYLQHGPWYYMSRVFVYSFGSNNQTLMLPIEAGSIYADRLAWMPFAFDPGRGFSDVLDGTYRALKHPLAVRDVIETYPESPEGWLAPHLTEPFEEGVEGTLGGKKKK
jgi:hypothetical protein